LFLLWLIRGQSIRRHSVSFPRRKALFRILQGREKRIAQHSAHEASQEDIPELHSQIFRELFCLFWREIPGRHQAASLETTTHLRNKKDTCQLSSFITSMIHGSQSAAAHSRTGRPDWRRGRPCPWGFRTSQEFRGAPPGDRIDGCGLRYERTSKNSSKKILPYSPEHLIYFQALRI